MSINPSIAGAPAGDAGPALAAPPRRCVEGRRRRTGNGMAGSTSTAPSVQARPNPDGRAQPAHDMDRQRLLYVYRLLNERRESHPTLQLPPTVSVLHQRSGSIVSLV